MSVPLNRLCFLLGGAVCLLGAGNVLSGYQVAFLGTHYILRPEFIDILPLVGPAMVAVLFVIQSFTMVDPVRTLRLTVVVALFGMVLDSLLIHFGVYWVSVPMGTNRICPFWITAMWITLGISLHGWLLVFSRRLLLAIPVGAAGMLGGYLLADWLGAIGIDISPWLAFPLLALLGASLLPGLVMLANSHSYRLRETQNLACNSVSS